MRRESAAPTCGAGRASDRPGTGSRSPTTITSGTPVRVSVCMCFKLCVCVSPSHWCNEPDGMTAAVLMLMQRRFGPRLMSRRSSSASVVHVGEDDGEDVDQRRRRRRERRWRVAAAGVRVSVVPLVVFLLHRHTHISRRSDDPVICLLIRCLSLFSRQQMSLPVLPPDS